MCAFDWQQGWWPWTAIRLNFLGISHDFADLRGNNGKTKDDRPVVSAMHTLRWYIAGHSSARGSTITISWVKMAIFNLDTRKYPAIRKPSVMLPRLLLTINCKSAVDFFARGLHTRTAVARLPLRQLGFLVYHITMDCNYRKPYLTVIINSKILRNSTANDVVSNVSKNFTFISLSLSTFRRQLKHSYFSLY